MAQSERLEGRTGMIDDIDVRFEAVDILKRSDFWVEDYDHDAGLVYVLDRKSGRQFEIQVKVTEIR